MKLELDPRVLYHTPPLEDLTDVELQVIKQVYQHKAFALEVVREGIERSSLIRLVEHNYLMVLPTFLGFLVVVGFNGRRALGLKFIGDLVHLESALQSVYRQEVLRALASEGFVVGNVQGKGNTLVYRDGVPHLFFGNFRGYSAPFLWKTLKKHGRWVARMGGKILVAQPNQKSFRNIKEKHGDLFVPVSYRMQIKPLAQVPTSVEL